MLYTPLIKKALLISFNVHKDQFDKSGTPYIYHPFHLAEQMQDEYTICVALLHDTVEDGKITLDYLRSEGFPDEIVEAVKLMTHKKRVPYLDYIRNLKKNPIACAVKIADLEHNMDVTRLNVLDTKTYERLEKYKKAIQILKETN